MSDTVAEIKEKAKMDDSYKSAPTHESEYNEKTNDADDGQIYELGGSPLQTNKTEEGLLDMKAYNWCSIISLTLVSTLSGLCFGYDTAVISGATLYFENDFPGITKSQAETVVSLAILGASIGALITGSIADQYGRKYTIILGDILMTIGTVLMYFAQNLPMLCLGRLIAGLGFGTECMACNVYLAEVSPRRIRGSMVTANNACCIFG